MNSHFIPWTEHAVRAMLNTPRDQRVSPSAPAKSLHASHLVVRRYERDEIPQYRSTQQKATSAKEHMTTTNYIVDHKAPARPILGIKALERETKWGKLPSLRTLPAPDRSLRTPQRLPARGAQLAAGPSGHFGTPHAPHQSPRGRQNQSHTRSDGTQTVPCRDKMV